MARKKADKTVQQTIPTTDEALTSVAYINPAIQAEVAAAMPVAPAASINNWLDSKWEESLRGAAQSLFDEIHRDPKLTPEHLFEAMKSDKLRPHLKHLKFPVPNGHVSAPTALQAVPASTGKRRGRPPKAAKAGTARIELNKPTRRGRPKKGAAAPKASAADTVFGFIEASGADGILKQDVAEKLGGISKKWAGKAHVVNNAIAALKKAKRIKLEKEGRSAKYFAK